MKSKHIAWFLYSISGLICLLSVFVILIFLFFMVTGKNKIVLLKKGGSTIALNSFYEDGYNIPASLTIQLPADTIVEYEYLNGAERQKFNKYKNEAHADMIKNQWNKITADSNFKHISTTYTGWYADTLSTKDISYENLPVDSVDIAQYVDKKINSGKIIASPAAYDSKVTLKVKGKTFYQNFLLAIYNLLGFLLTFICSYQATQIFYSIYKKKYFFPTFSKRLKIVGITILWVVLLRFGLSIIFSKWYGMLRLITVPFNISDKLFNVYYNSLTDFDTNLFGLGLTILVLREIIIHGYRLEKEQSLTI